jgi:polyhydroxyalkanoate synthesis regulator phasin
MKSNVKKFFLLGLGVAAAAGAAGLAFANRKKIKTAVDELVKKGKIKAEDAEVLAKDLMAETKKYEAKVAARLKAKKPAKKK